MAYFSTEETKDKLLLLYFLNESGLSLSREQFLHVLTRQGWMEYFPFAHAIHGLIENGFLSLRSRPVGECLLLTQAGKDAINSFVGRLPASMRRRIDDYLKENRPSLMAYTQHIASYRKISDHSYMVDLRIVDGDQLLLSLSIDAPSAEQARSFCDHWPDRAQDVYTHIFNDLSQQQK